MDKLPWTYYVIVSVTIFLAGVVGCGAFITFGWNPYIGFLIGSNVMVLWEVAVLKRNGY